MKKDVLSALVLGFCLGALAALVIIRLPTFIKSSKKPHKEIASTNVSPTPQTDKTSITIDKPKDLTIFGINKIELEGRAEKAQAVTIETYETSLVLEPDKDGRFRASIELAEGGNQVIITGFDAEGNDESKILNLFYTAEKI